MPKVIDYIGRELRARRNDQGSFEFGLTVLWMAGSIGVAASKTDIEA